MKRVLFCSSLFFCAIALTLFSSIASAQIGDFDETQDIYASYDNLGADGGAEYDAASQTYTVWGSGNDIDGEADAFRYVYKTISGDFDVETVCEWDVERTTNYDTQDWIKMAVMVRQDLTPGSVDYSFRIRKDGQYSFQYRPVADGTCSSTPGDKRVTLGSTGVDLPEWRLRLSRAGNYFSIAYKDADGQWVQVGSTVEVTMTDPIYVGLGVTSHDVGEVAYGKFSDVSISEDVKTFAVRTLPVESVAPGDALDVTLDVVNPIAATLTEIVPDGWEISDVSDGGEVSGNQITWSLDGSVESVSYTVTVSSILTESTFGGAMDGVPTAGDYSLVIMAPGVGEFDTFLGLGGAAGQVYSDGDRYSIDTASGDIWNAADSCGFLYKEMTGSFSIKGEMYLDYGDGAADWAKGGLMVRNNLTDGSSNAFLHLNSTSQMRRQVRLTQSASTTSGTSIDSDSHFGIGEIVRIGKAFYFYYYDLNDEPVLLDVQILEDLEDPVYVGLALSSHSEGNTSYLDVYDVQITPMDFDVQSGSRTVSPEFANMTVNGNEVIYYEAGGAASIDLSLTLLDGASSDATYVENTPEGWAISGISTDNGEAVVDGDAIQWNLNGASGVVTLHYELTPPEGFDGVAELSGEIEDVKLICELRPVYPAADPIFDYHADIYAGYDRLGALGGMEYDADLDTYTVWGSGHDIDSNDDAFHYAFKQVQGDFTISASNEWIPELTTNYETQGWLKFTLMARQDFTPGSLDMVARIRPDGQFSWQSRAERDGTYTSTPDEERVVLGDLALDTWNVRLQRAGDVFTITYLDENGDWTQVGESVTLALTDPIYLGIAVTAHDAGQVAYTYVRDVELDAEGVVGIENWSIFE